MSEQSMPGPSTRRRRHSLVLSTVATLVLALFAGAGPAAADPAPGSSPAATATVDGAHLTVEYVLRVNPQARVIQPNVVEVGPGIAVIVPSGGVSTLSADFCSKYWICMWEHSYGQGFGAGLAFYSCSGPGQAVDLMSLRYPDGANVGRGSGDRWNDRISSYSNNQSTGTHSWFANWVGSSLNVVLNSYAPDYSGDLSYLGVNDIIDAVHVCG